MPPLVFAGSGTAYRVFPVCAPQAIEAALSRFLENSFLNGDLGRGKSHHYPDDVLELWAKLEGKKRFPRSELVGYGRVLRDLL